MWFNYVHNKLLARGKSGFYQAYGKNQVNAQSIAQLHCQLPSHIDFFKSMRSVKACILLCESAVLMSCKRQVRSWQMVLCFLEIHFSFVFQRQNACKLRKNGKPTPKLTSQNSLDRPLAKQLILFWESDALGCAKQFWIRKKYSGLFAFPMHCYYIYFDDAGNMHLHTTFMPKVQSKKLDVHGSYYVDDAAVTYRKLRWPVRCLLILYLRW